MRHAHGKGWAKAPTWTSVHYGSVGFRSPSLCLATTYFHAIHPIIPIHGHASSYKSDLRICVACRVMVVIARRPRCL